MTKLISTVLILFILIYCRGKVEPAIQSGVDECENCTMIIDDIDQGAVAIDSGENLHPFCSPVCMIFGKNTIKQQGVIELDQYYLFDHNDSHPIAAADAVIVHGDFNTAMGYGLLAFADEVTAKSFASEAGGVLMDWNDLRTEYEIPDRKISLSCRAGSEPNVFEVERGELISVCIESPNGEACSVTLRGYDLEFAGGGNNPNCTEFVADRPGEGFVFVESDNRILASVHVTGDHTTEEKLYK